MKDTLFSDAIFKKFHEKTLKKQPKQPVWTATNSCLFFKHLTTINKGNLSAQPLPKTKLIRKFT